MRLLFCFVFVFFSSAYQVIGGIEDSNDQININVYRLLMHRDKNWNSIDYYLETQDVFERFLDVNELSENWVFSAFFASAFIGKKTVYDRMFALFESSLRLPDLKNMLLVVVNSYGKTILHMAASGSSPEHIAIVEHLLSYDTPSHELLMTKDCNGHTALMDAILVSQNIQMVEKLINKNPDIVWQIVLQNDTDNVPVLILACVDELPNFTYEKIESLKSWIFKANNELKSRSSVISKCFKGPVSPHLVMSMEVMQKDLKTGIEELRKRIIVARYILNKAVYLFEASSRVDYKSVVRHKKQILSDSAEQLKRMEKRFLKYNEPSATPFFCGLW